MKSIIAKLNFKIGSLLGLVLLAGAISIFGLAPRVATISRADGCSPVYSTPIFNPYPVTWANDAGYNCTDFAVVSGNVAGAGVWAPSFSAHAGDSVSIRIYVHNGAASNSGQIMHDVQVKTNIDYNSGLVATTLSASNAASKSGQVSITLDPNTHLELTSGNPSPSIGDLDPCFQYAQIFTFTMKVVANSTPAPTEHPSGTISGSVGGQVTGQCLLDGTVRWSTQNVSQALVTVSNPKLNSNSYYDNDSVFSASLNSSGADAPWIAPNTSYRFTLWAVVPSGTSGSSQHSFYAGSAKQSYNVIELYETWLTGGALTCGTTPPPAATPAGTISATLGGQVTGQCLYNANVTWSTQNVSQALVTVSDPTLNSNSVYSNDKVYGTTLSGQYTAPWIAPKTNYRFTLWQVNPSSGGQTITFQGGKTYNVKEIAETWLTGGATLSCNTAPTPTASLTVSLGGQISGQCLWNGIVTWSTSNVQNPTVYVVDPVSGQKTVFSQLPSGSNQPAPWLKPGYVYHFQLSGSNIQTIDKTVSTAGLSCGNTNPQTLTCSAASGSYNVGDTAVFTAAGGSGSYSWSGSGSPASGSGSAFNTVFSSSGSKTVTVSSSDGQVASCSTTINQPNSQQGSLLLTKTVKNLTAGDSAFSHSTSGKQGDTLQYQIQVSAGSAITLSSVVVTDTFASGLSYISNSLLVNGQPHASGLSSGGLTFASLSQSAPLTITYQATIAATNGTLVNTAQASASNSSNSPSDQASVAVTYVNPGQPALSITKQVENLTQGGGYSSSISANKGDVVQYQVVVRNVGQATANNVFVNDSNPVGVQPLYNISASVQMTGGIPQGIALGNLSAGASVTVTYQGTVNVQSGTVINTATVSADNAASQNASAQVYVNAPNTGNTGGDCNNSSNSCNTNTNNNNQNGSGTNSSNQNNQNNINGDNNTVTNTNNNCVNNSCNVYYINNAGSTVPANQFSQLSITKNVRLYGSGTFQNSVSAQNGQSVQFEIVVTNTGSAIANNVRVTDMLPSGLSLSGGSVTVNGSWVSDSNIYGGMYVGNLYGGQSARIDFTATVNAAGNSTVQNTATASSDNAGSVQASAWVFLSSGSILGGNVNLSYQKSAFNNSKNSDATVVNAAPGDSITYTLTVTNNGNAPANSFIITDDLSQVLPYADVVDNGGGSLSGNTISFPGLTVPAGGSVTRSFKVQVKTSLSGSLSYVMSNSYGNNVSVRINNPQVAGAFTAPTTGADTDALTFSALLTAAAGAFRHRKSLLKLLFS